MDRPDGVDPCTVPVAAAQFPNLQTPLPKLRVGWCAEASFKPVDVEIQETVSKAAKAFKASGERNQRGQASLFGSSQGIAKALRSSESRRNVQCKGSGHVSWKTFRLPECFRRQRSRQASLRHSSRQAEYSGNRERRALHPKSARRCKSRDGPDCR